MDEADVAWNFTQAFLTGAIDKARANRGKTRETCLECGGIIPQARREAVPGCDLCINCQREFERA